MNVGGNMNVSRSIDKKEFEGTIKLFIGDDDIIDEEELANVLQLADRQHIATTNVSKSIALKISKYKRVKQTIVEYLKRGGLISDIELAAVLKSNGVDTSSSTVGRDLVGSIAKTIISEQEYEQILLLRRQNLLNGKQKGGQNYALNNVFLKDENGKFMGSSKR